MPSLTTLHYNSENLSFKYDVYIDKQGHFTTTLPDDVTEKLIKIGITLATNRRQKPGFFSEDSLRGLEHAVNKIADQYSKKEIISEKIIMKYSVDTRCSYCRSAKGNIYPNGGWEQDAEGRENGYHWIEGTKKQYGMERGGYGFSVVFEIWKKKTWRFPDGEETNEYNRLENEDFKEDETLSWLYSLCNLRVDDNTCKEIEYTKEIGLFFKNMVLFIFSINERIYSIFGDEFDLSKIEPRRLTSSNPLFEKGA